VVPVSAKTWTYRYRFRVVRVVDGDGLVAAIDCGLRITMVLPLRLAGCNAAEKRTPEGLAATAFVDQWVKDHADRDGWLAVITGKNPGDNYGRWLAEVQSLDGVHDLTDDLIEAGHAVPWDGTGPKPGPVSPPVG
jgi:endonuclease YncB( thermonuclease family)